MVSAYYIVQRICQLAISDWYFRIVGKEKAIKCGNTLDIQLEMVRQRPVRLRGTGKGAGSLERREEECLTPAMIDDYLEYLKEKGRSSSSLESYSRILKGIYEFLPEGKMIRGGTGAVWKSYMEGQGFSPVTVDCRISVWNGLVQYLGHREWQMDDFCREKGEEQPELSRAEYLKLLSAAKHMGKEKSYLLIKTLGGAGMRVQELPQLTVDAVGRGVVELEYHNARQRRVLYLPEGLRGELLGYIEREGLREGPVFCSPEGRPMARSSINYFIAAVSREAHVGEGKANPRGLWKMYQGTCMGIRANVSALIEQAYQRMMAEEQLAVGWDT